MKELADLKAEKERAEGRLKVIEEVYACGLCAFPTQLTEEELYRQFKIIEQAIRKAVEGGDTK